MRCLIFIIFVITTITGCNDDESRDKKEIKRLYGKQIKFCNNYESISNNDSLNVDTELDNTIKIVTYIDSVSCTPCVFQSLLLWESKFTELEDKIGFIVVVHPNDKQELYKILNTLQIKYPLMYDTDNVYIKQNKLNVLAKNRTFLLDKDNKIVVVGEPILNDNLWGLYKTRIKQLSKNNGLLPN